MSEFIIENYDAIIFDCDGVLIDINELKCQAFSQAIGDYPSSVREKFIKYCRNSFGISRYEKFKVFFSDFAKIEFNQNEYEKFLKIYSDICKKEYLTCNLTQDCLVFLEQLKNNNKRLFIASGSDEEELKYVFENRKLSHFFDRIYGSPKSKVESTRLILEGIDKEKILFIGDAYSDMKTAEQLNLDFIYMNQYSIQSEEQDLICKENSLLTIKTFKDILSLASHKL